MTIAKRTGTVLVLAAIAMGTLLDQRPVREVPRYRNYVVLQGDLHVHGFPGDGGLSPWEIGREAARRRLDVIVVTNHNQVLAAAVAARSGRRGDGRDLPIVLVGQELTTPRFHMIAAGISRTIDWRLSAPEAIREAHAQGGVAIAAHPISEGALSWIDQGEEAHALLDGAEVAHPLMIGKAAQREELLHFYQYAARKNDSLAPIGSSDFHWGGVMGRCRTFLFARDATERGVLDAIREARTVAFDGRDEFIGPPDLAAAARAIAAADRAVPDRSFLMAVVNWLALAGLLLVILVR